MKLRLTTRPSTLFYHFWGTLSNNSGNLIRGWNPLLFCFIFRGAKPPFLIFVFGMNAWGSPLTVTLDDSDNTLSKTTSVSSILNYIDFILKILDPPNYQESNNPKYLPEMVNAPPTTPNSHPVPPWADIGEPGPLSEARPRANKVLATAKTGRTCPKYIKYILPV